MKIILFLLLTAFATSIYAQSSTSTPDQQELVKVETQAQFPGGKTEWIKFLQKNLNAAVPVDNQAPVGMYKVLIEFVVDADGSLSAFTATTKHGYGMEREAIRALKKSPKWIPAQLNDVAIQSKVSLPITFIVGTGR